MAGTWRHDTAGIPQLPHPNERERAGLVGTVMRSEEVRGEVDVLHYRSVASLLRSAGREVGPTPAAKR